MKLKTGYRIAEGIAALFILLFIYTAVSKLSEFRLFTLILSRSPLLSNHTRLVATAIPGIELLVAVLLFFPRTRTKGLFCAGLLMLVFTLYIAYMLAYSPSLPCACGGAISGMGWKGHLAMNLVLTGLAFWGWQLERAWPGSALLGPQQTST